MARVMISTPTYGGKVWDEQADSVANNAANLAAFGHSVTVRSLRGYGCGPARTRIADMAVEGGYDYVLMVDDDVVMPQDALQNLLEHETGVCLGFYARQGKSDGTTCLSKLGRHNFDDPFSASELRGLREAGTYTVEVKGGGMGCALIRTDVFGRIEYPYFKWVDYDDRHGTLSEDLYFCVQCSRANIPIYADTRVACGHFFRHKQEVF